MKAFAAFRLDTLNECLWGRSDARTDERILLTPKAFEVLTYLIDPAGCLVTHDELLGAVWLGGVVEPQAVGKRTLEVHCARGPPQRTLYS